LQTRLDITEPPKDLEVCFSPEEHCDAKLIRFVQTAKSRIDLAVYDINHEQLVFRLLALAKKIPVRIVVDKRQASEPHSLVALLLKGGANVRFGTQRGIMHNKFVLIDGKAVETGSFNFTHHASLANNENQVYLFSPQVVSRFKNRFDTLWAAGKPATSIRKLSSE
jgi:phosphatidylserine/phosphatidylglycerophosphate/cardiolipin synthase-like enzyme